DDLTSVLEYLRSPFKPGNGFYLQHMQEALARKKEFRQWLIANVPALNDSPLLSDPYTSLSRSEDQDYGQFSYNFDFNAIWAEVNASTPSTTTQQTDLFLSPDEDLAKGFKIPDEVMVKRDAPPELDADSPATDIETLRALEKVGFEPFFSTEKNIVERSPEP